MGLKKQILEKLQALEEKVNTLSGENQIKIKKYEEQKEYLKDFNMKVSKTDYVVDKNGNIGIEVHYSVPKQIIQFDDENNMIPNKTFKAINMLNLISMEDMQQISYLLDEAKKRNK